MIRVLLWSEFMADLKKNRWDKMLLYPLMENIALTY